MKLKMTKRDPGKASEERASPEVAEAADAEVPHYGSWGKLASARTLSEVGRLKDELRQGVREGRLAVRIPISRIDDEMGSDRIDGWADDAEFHALLADIERRGQLQPIQVECRSMEWLPLGLGGDDPVEASEASADDPDGVGTRRFTLIAGRRRLEACRRLGRPVLATISFRVSESGAGQLVDRFLENRMRADLSPFERLRSIGELAASGVAASDIELSTLIGVDRGTISRGRRVFENASRLEAIIDLRSATRDEILEAIGRLDGQGIGIEKTAEKPRRSRAAKTGMLTRKVGSATVVVKRGPRGVSFSIAGEKLDDQTVERALDALAQVLSTIRVAGGNGDISDT
jgi:ParB family chromosome partitioning protein